MTWSWTASSTDRSRSTARIVSNSSSGDRAAHKVSINPATVSLTSHSTCGAEPAAAGAAGADMLPADTGIEDEPTPAEGVAPTEDSRSVSVAHVFEYVTGHRQSRSLA